MNKKILIFLLTGMVGVAATAQIPEEKNFYSTEPQRTPEPFLFSVTTLTPDDLPWSLNYSGSYGERVTGPFGYDGIGQQFAVKGYLGNRFTLYANAAFGFPDENNVSSAQQAEVIRDFIGGKSPVGFRLGAGLGISRDYSDVKSLLSRITLSFDALQWKIGGNLLLEKSLASDRDNIDVITSLGFQYHLTGSLYGGLEAVGEDLEGFWEEDEAEGGAKVLVGPSVNLVPNHSKFSFSVSGGPVMYATHSEVTNPNAIRELPSQTGLTVRARIIFSLSGS